MSRLSAAQLLELVLDRDSFASWDTPPLDVHPGPAYAAELAAAQDAARTARRGLWASCSLTAAFPQLARH